jgi:hypothetical protein
LLLQLFCPLLFQAALTLLILFLAELSRALLLLRHQLLLALFGETLALLAILLVLLRLLSILILLPLLVLLLLNLLLLLPVQFLLLLIVGALLLLVPVLLLLGLPVLILLPFILLLLLLNLLLLASILLLLRLLLFVRVLRLLRFRRGLLLLLLLRGLGLFFRFVLFFVLLVLLWVSKSSGPKKHEQSCRAENCNAFHGYCLDSSLGAGEESNCVLLTSYQDARIRRACTMNRSDADPRK